MKRFKLIALAFAGTALVTSTYAQGYLLTINDSNPSAVVFTATTNSPTVNNNNTTTANGIDLLGFFNGSVNQFSSSATPGSLAGGASGQIYNAIQSDNFSGATIDLSLFTTSGTTIQTFSIGNPAFTGSWTLNLASFANLLPAGGATGSLRSGTSNTGGVVIGQWQVLPNAVPEPGTLALASLGGLAACFLARRRK